MLQCNISPTAKNKLDMLKQRGYTIRSLVETAIMSLHVEDFPTIEPTVKHGTLAAYNKGCRCPECRDRNTKYRRARRKPVTAYDAVYNV